jgi:hypothetical protein
MLRLAEVAEQLYNVRRGEVVLIDLDEIVVVPVHIPEKSLSELADRRRLLGRGKVVDGGQLLQSQPESCRQF